VVARASAKPVRPNAEYGRVASAIAMAPRCSPIAPTIGLAALLWRARYGLKCSSLEVRRAVLFPVHYRPLRCAECGTSWIPRGSVRRC
jgi:hypothetical protein